MADNHTPTRRNDVIRCKNCGEDYSVTYKRCPFCDELRPGQSQRSSGRGGKRVASSGSRSSGSADFNLLRIIGIVVPLALIIAAVYICFTVLGPMITAGQGEDPSPSTSASAPIASDPADPVTSDPVISDPVASDPVVSPVTGAVTAIALDQSDFTLPANGSHRINASLTPSGTGDAVTWSVDNASAASISQDGTITNTNTGSSTVTVTVTASCGNVSATCLVRCRAGSTGATVTADPSPSASASNGAVSTGAAVISNAGTGLRVRSGPGTSYEVLASLVNGNPVTVVESAGDGWYKITFDAAGGVQTTGYVLGEYLTNQ